MIGQTHTFCRKETNILYFSILQPFFIISLQTQHILLVQSNTLC